jgi:hypothetical protein
VERAVQDDHVALRPALRTSLMAASFASAPEFAKNTRPPSEASDSRSARRPMGSV